MIDSKTVFTIKAHVHNATSTPAKKQCFLEQIEGPGAPKKIFLEGALIVIGRAQNADIRLDSPQTSREHARLMFKSNEYHIQDTNSTNGVYLNSVKLHSAILRDGDNIQIGDHVFVFHEGE